VVPVKVNWHRTDQQVVLTQSVRRGRIPLHAKEINMATADPELQQAIDLINGCCKSNAKLLELSVCLDCSGSFAQLAQNASRSDHPKICRLCIHRYKASLRRGKRIAR